MPREVAVQYIGNVSFIQRKGSRERLWCDVVTIRPVSDYDGLLPPYGIVSGHVTGYRDDCPVDTFKIFHRPDETIGFRRLPGSPHGVLNVGSDVYHVEARHPEAGVESDTLVAADYSALWKAVASMPGRGRRTLVFGRLGRMASE